MTQILLNGSIIFVMLCFTFLAGYREGQKDQRKKVKKICKKLYRGKR